MTQARNFQVNPLWTFLCKNDFTRTFYYILTKFVGICCLLSRIFVFLSPGNPPTQMSYCVIWISFNVADVNFSLFWLLFWHLFNIYFSFGFFLWTSSMIVLKVTYWVSLSLVLLMRTAFFSFKFWRFRDSLAHWVEGLRTKSKKLCIGSSSRWMHFFPLFLFLINTFFAKWSCVELINNNKTILITIAKELLIGSLIFWMIIWLDLCVYFCIYYLYISPFITYGLFGWGDFRMDGKWVRKK